MFIFRSILFFILLLSLSFVCLGKTIYPSASPTPNPRIEQEREAREMRREQRIYEQKILGSIGAVDRRTKAEKRADCKFCTASGKPKKYPSKSELEIIAPNVKYNQQFADFLQSNKTGLTRLISDTGCGSDSRIVKSNDDCLKYEIIPGYGSTYSFRQDKFVLGRFADVVYKDGVLYSFGDLTNGFFTKLMDVPIADITKNTEGAEFLFSYTPKRNLNEIQEQNDKFVEGFDSNDFVYKKSARLVEGKTYILRSIAYKVKTQTIENERYIVFDNTKIDKRRDMILAFRVLEIDEDGSVTFLWKILKEKSAPKIIFPKKSK